MDTIHALFNREEIEGAIKQLRRQLQAFPWALAPRIERPGDGTRHQDRAGDTVGTSWYQREAH